MKAKTTWVLVADGARAYSFARHGAGGALVAIRHGTFVHEVERVSAMGADRPGRVRESADTAHHALRRTSIGAGKVSGDLPIALPNGSRTALVIEPSITSFSSPHLGTLGDPRAAQERMRAKGSPGNWRRT